VSRDRFQKFASRTFHVSRRKLRSPLRLPGKGPLQIPGVVPPLHRQKGTPFRRDIEERLPPSFCCPQTKRWKSFPMTGSFLRASRASIEGLLHIASSRVCANRSFTPPFLFPPASRRQSLSRHWLYLSLERLKDSFDGLPFTSSSGGTLVTTCFSPDDGDFFASSLYSLSSAC